ncbi:MAG: TetR/AcrR family transcriptional regulator [Candidatus Binatia bacterium]|nr:TetR/AcrR family transcriptional regulator [Candidatus Binatia bacterium]
MQAKTLLREQARASVRQAILDAARVLFAKEGYAGLSMRRLAESIGYTPRTIYFYFADKDDLLSELIEEDVGRLADRLEEVAAEYSDAGERLEAVALAYVAFGLENPHAYEAAFMLRHHPLTREAATRKAHVQGQRLLAVLTRVVAESGRVTPEADLPLVVQALRCALHGVVSMHLLRRHSTEVSWEALVRYLVAGVVGRRRIS